MEKKVLVVEDDERAARLFARMLRAMGLETEHVASKSAALRSLRRAHGWCSFVIDVRLSVHGYEGVEVLEHAALTFPTTPRALVSAHLDRAVINRAQCLGGRFICKPCSVEDLRPFAFESLSSCIEEIELRDHVVGWGLRVEMTAKEQQIIALLASGRSREECRREADVVESTLASHVRSILARACRHGAPDRDIGALVNWLLRSARAARKV
jgi:DNA-binding NtrC family response regulator